MCSSALRYSADPRRAGHGHRPVRKGGDRGPRGPRGSGGQGG